MTWYAHHVFAAPPAMKVLESLFPGHVFHVRDLSAYRKTRSEVYAVMVPSKTDPGGPIEREVVEGPEVPEGGLVVVRELADLTSHAAEWFDDDALSWERAGGAAPNELASVVLKPERVMGEEAELAPPAAFLALLRKISRETSSPVSFCGVFTWGGDLEYAFSWVFDGQWDADYAYRSSGHRRVEAWSAAHPAIPRTIVDGDVLTLTLVHHGLLLADHGIFELHKRAFPWEQHRVG